MEIIKALAITDTAYGGYGVGRDQTGRVLFVTGAVEGDTIDAKVTEEKNKFAYGTVVGITRPSSLRESDPCGQSPACGGCLFGHIKYEAQLSIKRRIIEKAFGKFSEPGFMPDIKIKPSPRDGYRIRATFRARNGELGFYGFKSNDFIPCGLCRAVKPSLLEKAAAYAEAGKITGEIYAVETSEGIALASVKTERAAPAFKYPFDGVKINGRISGLNHAAYNTPYGPVGIGYGTFFQANGFILDSFQETASKLVYPFSDIVELYAGSGFFTCALADRARTVRAVESDAEAVRLASVYGYPVRRADAGEFLKSLNGCESVFVDPPRDGLSRMVTAELKRLAPSLIVYVSCDPMTLARDAARLSDDYEMTDYYFFDMFPDTFHIESVVAFSRKKKIGAGVGNDLIRRY